MQAMNAAKLHLIPEQHRVQKSLQGRKIPECRSRTESLALLSVAPKQKLNDQKEISKIRKHFHKNKYIQTQM